MLLGTFSTLAYSFAVLQPGNELSALPPASCPPKPASPEEQEQIFYAYLKVFYNTTKPDPKEAMKLYIANNLIQHNPGIKDGRKAQIEAVAPIYKKNDFTLQNTLFDLVKGYGVIYNAVYPKGDCEGVSPPKCENTMMVVDIYRFDGGCMVEHWDVLEYPDS